MLIPRNLKLFTSVFTSFSLKSTVSSSVLLTVSRRCELSSMFAMPQMTVLSAHFTIEFFLDADSNHIPTQRLHGCDCTAS